MNYSIQIHTFVTSPCYLNRLLVIFHELLNSATKRKIGQLPLELTDSFHGLFFNYSSH